MQSWVSKAGCDGPAQGEGVRGSPGHVFPARLILPTLLPLGKQSKDFARTRMDVRLEIVTLAHFQEAPFFYSAIKSTPPCSFWKRVSENFLENSLYPGISPPAKGLEALQNEQCSTCPVAVDNNGWGHGHWGIQTVHCQLRPQTAPQSVSLPLSQQGQCIFLKQEMLSWMTAYNKHFMLLWVPWQCYLILWKPISASLPSHTWAHNGISSSYILWAWYHRYRKGRRLKFRLKKKDKEEKNIKGFGSAENPLEWSQNQSPHPSGLRPRKSCPGRFIQRAAAPALCRKECHASLRAPEMPLERGSHHTEGTSENTKIRTLYPKFHK